MTLLEMVDSYHGLLDPERPLACAAAMALAIFPSAIHAGDARLLMQGIVGPGMGMTGRHEEPEWFSGISPPRKAPLLMVMRAIRDPNVGGPAAPYLRLHLWRDVAIYIDRLVDVLVEPARTAALCVLGPRHKDHPPHEAIDPATAAHVFDGNHQLALADLLDPLGETGSHAAAHLRDGRFHHELCWVRHWLTKEVFRL